MADVRVQLGPRSYTVTIRSGAARDAGTIGRRVARGRRTALVTSARIAPLHADRLERALRRAGLRPVRIVTPDGERAKTPGHVERLHQRFSRAELDRHDSVMVLGGGTLGDTVGFAAATYLRGVTLVQIPTTLMAQVDSAIGGKTGVNLPTGKNLVGAIWQPAAVICDPELLETLPRRQIASGLAEVVKYGLIADPVILTQLERQLAQTPSAAAVTPALITRCVRVKAHVVEQDEREDGLRRILNFGHTLGHALENLRGYGRLLHGEAVALGMVVALELSRARAGLDEAHVRRAVALLRRAFPRLRMPGTGYRRLEHALRRDKKRVGGRARWVLLRAPGEPVIEEIRSPAAVDRALAAARSRWSATSR